MRYKKYHISVISVLVPLIFGVYFFRNGQKAPQYVETDANTVPLVEGFPTVPIYPHSVLIESTKNPYEGDFRYSSSWTVTDSVPLVSAWFILHLTANGFNITQYPADLNDPSVQLIVIDSLYRIMNISIIADPDSTNTRIVIEDYKFGAEEEEES